MKRLLFTLVLFFALTMQSCSLLFPSQAKAVTEEKQLKELQKQTYLMKESNRYDSLRIELLIDQNEILKEIIN